MKILRRSLLAVILIAGACGVTAAPQAPLSKQEHDILASSLRKSEPGYITVVCADEQCKPLARDLVVLLEASKWRVKTIWHGGLGIDGVTNIRVNSCGMEGVKIEKVLRAATSRKIDMVDDGKCPDGEREIFVVIGPQL